ncbi:MAG: hypothetical protein CSA47_01120 [Gammaproteobacteria bacterium]|nr:MAG: hypothetical protein CSA47_01120 [Gammaproteobacteria bacterium]
MKRLKKIALVTLIGTSMTTGAWADNYDKGGKHHGGQKSHHMGSPMKQYRHINLSGKQKQQMKTIFKTARQTIKSNREKIRPLYRQLKQLSQTTSYDAGAVANIAKQMAALKQANIEAMTYAKYQAWQILTAEQKQKIKALEKKRQTKMHKRKKDNK